MFPLHDNIPHKHPPLINSALILTNVIIFIFQTSLPEPYLILFLQKYGLVPARYTSPVWAFMTHTSSRDFTPFLSNMFLHGGWLHLISNMWFLFIFGDNVEDRLGHVRYLLFYLLCGLMANLTHFLTNPSSTVPVVGASGAIAGVMGAYLLLFPYAKVLTFIPIFFLPYFIELPALLFLLAWFIAQLFSGIFSLGALGHSASIAWWAHIGGFISGMILLSFLLKPQARKG